MIPLRFALGLGCVAVTVVALALVTRTVLRLVATLRSCQPDPGRLRPFRRRAMVVLREITMHTRFGKTHVAVAHWLVMTGFALLVPNVVMAYFEVFDPHAQLPLLAGWGPYELLVEVMAVGTVLGIGTLMVIRQRQHPRRIGPRSRFYGSRFGRAYFVEAVVLLEGASVIGIRAASVAAGIANPPYWAAPVSRALAKVMPANTTAIVVALAVVKILVATGWLIVVSVKPTMGVAWHRFTAFANVYAKRDPDGGMALGSVRPMMSGGRVLDFAEADPDRDTFGVGTICDLTWKGLLDLVTCTECGRCQEQCPAWIVGGPLSPKLLVTRLREQAFMATEWDRPLVGDVADDAVDRKALWACTTCGACVQACPVDIEHVDHIVDLRRHQVLMAAEFPAELVATFRKLEQRGNPWGLPSREWLTWSRGLSFDVPVVNGTLGQEEYLFWIGCAGAFDDRARRTTRAVAELLHLAGVQFAVLGGGETCCCGDAARRTGNEVLYRSLAEQNIATINAAFGDRPREARTILVTCPHCLNTLGNEYPELGGTYTVIHHTQLLNRLVRQRRLVPVLPAEGSPQRSARPQQQVTYQDPCYLARHNGVYDPPRELLAACGAELQEMPRHGERSMCCGAGGGRMWQEEPPGTRINLARVDEALATGSATIATGCPFCRIMIGDGIADRRGEQANDAPSVDVVDVAQQLLQAVRRGLPTAETTDETHQETLWKS